MKEKRREGKSKEKRKKGKKEREKEIKGKKEREEEISRAHLEIILKDKMPLVCYPLEDTCEYYFLICDS